MEPIHYIRTEREVISRIRTAFEQDQHVQMDDAEGYFRVQYSGPGTDGEAVVTATVGYDLEYYNREYATPNPDYGSKEIAKRVHALTLYFHEVEMDDAHKHFEKLVEALNPEFYIESFKAVEDYNEEYDEYGTVIYAETHEYNAYVIRPIGKGCNQSFSIGIPLMPGVDNFYNLFPQYLDDDDDKYKTIIYKYQEKNSSRVEHVDIPIPAIPIAASSDNILYLTLEEPRRFMSLDAEDAEAVTDVFRDVTHTSALFYILQDAMKDHMDTGDGYVNLPIVLSLLSKRWITY